MKRATSIVLAFLFVAPSVARAQRTSVSGDIPIYANGGLPDLTIDPKRFTSQMEIVDRQFQAGSCEIEEGTVGGTGYRRLLRFDTVLINSGDGDLRVGNPADPANPYASWFIFATCHRHYHIRDFSNYVLLRPDGSVAAPGHKQAFCLEDLLKYETVKSNNYTCANQGVMACYNPKTGERLYQQRIGDKGGSYSASPVAADGKIYLSSEDGEIFVVKAGPKYELLATNQMGEVLMATPAISDGMIFVRGQHNVFAIAERGK